MAAQGSGPERTCVACREAAPQRDLVRFVRGGETVVPDPRGSMPGRGAYLHRDPRCVEIGVTRGVLARALRSSIPEDEVSNLMKLIEATEAE
ncbi:MAG: YlxR family protein [Actinomycetota bacterium]